MKKQIVNVGIIQIKCRKSAEENLTQALRRIQKVAKQGADIVCLPELFLSPYFCQTAKKRFFKLAEAVPGRTTKILGRLAKSLGISIVASLFEKSAGSRYFNTAVVIDERGRVGKYRKMHIPDDLKNHYGEKYYFSSGNLGFRSFKTNKVTTGVLVCWDQWFPEAARALAVKGAEIIFYPTAIGWQLKDRGGVNKSEYEAWQIIQRAHAIANNVYVVAVNRVGLENKLHFWGTSFVSDPYGRVIAQAPSDKEADLVVPCDLHLIKQMRQDWPFLEARRVKIEQR